MKKYIASLLFSALVFSGTALGKTPDKFVTYALPRTVVKVSVQANEENIKAGLYSRYTSTLLGIQTIEKDSTLFSITEVSLGVKTEADPNERYRIRLTPAQESTFNTLMESGYIILPSEENETPVSKCILPERKIAVENTLSAKKLYAKAQAAADAINKYRDDRYNIIIGNTDATYSGEAMGAALNEIDRQEQELLKDFLPSASSFKHNEEFEIVLPDDLSGKIEAFCFSPSLGILPSGSAEGEPYYLSITVEECSPAEDLVKENIKAEGLKYRVPAMCVIKLCYFDHTLCHLRVPVHQAGIEERINL